MTSLKIKFFEKNSVQIYVIQKDDSHINHKITLNWIGYRKTMTQLRSLSLY